MTQTKDGSKVFYKKVLIPADQGLEILTKIFISIRETPCFHYCMPKFEYDMLRVLRRKDESTWDYAKRRKALKRISKSSSRFAFESEEQALKHLKFLKRKQLSHMKRDALFIERLLSTPDEQLSKNHLIPETKELVHEHYVFD